MKIHDKFVIELAEVIKGYGNDYQDKEPFKLPCDYKFYEISGVAICEESFKKMKRLEDEINAVLDKIRAEILEEKECAYADFEQYKVDYFQQEWEDVFDSLPQDDFRYGMERCVEIIDKYRAESEG